MSADTLRRFSLAGVSALMGPKDQAFVRDKAAFLRSLGVGYGVGAIALLEDPSLPANVIAWALIRDGEFIKDADGVVPVYTTRKIAQSSAGLSGGGSDGEEPVRVRVTFAPKKPEASR